MCVVLQTSVPELGQQKTDGTGENVITVAKDPRYARYLKMVQVVSQFLPGFIINIWTSIP